MAIPIGGTPPAPDPNTDLVILQYNVAGRFFHQRLYVDKLNNTAGGIVTNGLQDYAYADTGHLFGLQTTTNETSLQVTITNYLAQVKRLYDNTVNFAIKSVWMRDGNHVLQEVFPTAALGAELGTGGSLTPAVVTPDGSTAPVFFEHILTTRSGHGGRVVLKYVGSDPNTLVKPVAVGANISGTTWERIVGYLTSADCRIMSHAGGRPMNQFALHSTPSAKLRRSDGFA